MRAPPAGASATRHFPPVERTTASAIASPSPAPSPPSVPRWNLSNRKGRCSTGIPGPLSSKAQAGEVALRANEHTYRPAGTRIPTGVVQQDAT